MEQCYGAIVSNPSPIIKSSDLCLHTSNLQHEKDNLFWLSSQTAFILSEWWHGKKSFFKGQTSYFYRKINNVFRHPQTVGLSHGRVKWKMCFFAWMHKEKIKQTLVAILSGFGLNLKGSFSPPIKGENALNNQT